jgi:hypothetical protein
MHKVERVRRFQGARGGDKTKTIVMGILERASENKPKRVRATVISDRKRATMLPEVAAAVSPDATIYADEYRHSLERLTVRHEGRRPHSRIR